MAVHFFRDVQISVHCYGWNIKCTDVSLLWDKSEKGYKVKMHKKRFLFYGEKERDCKRSIQDYGVGRIPTVFFG